MAEDDDRQMLCERCRKFVAVSQIKYVAKGDNSKMALCISCLKNFNIPGSRPAGQASRSADPRVESFTCERCNYRFTFNTSKNAMLRCPYCGKGDKIIAEKTRSVDSLLKGDADF